MVIVECVLLLVISDAKRSSLLVTTFFPGSWQNCKARFDLRWVQSTGFVWTVQNLTSNYLTGAWCDCVVHFMVSEMLLPWMLTTNSGRNGMLRYFISLWITWKKEKKRKWILYNNDKRLKLFIPGQVLAWETLRKGHLSVSLIFLFLKYSMIFIDELYR